MTISLRISIACRNRFIILTLFFSNERSLSETLVFLLIRDWFTLRRSVNVNLKKKWREKLCRIFLFVSRLHLVVRNSRKIFQSYWKVKIIIIICDDKHNPSFLNVDDYFQIMSWRSSFCDLQNFLRQLFFFKEK